MFPKRRIFQMLDDDRYQALLAKVPERAHGLARDIAVIVFQQFCKLRLKIVRKNADELGGGMPGRCAGLSEISSHGIEYDARGVNVLRFTRTRKERHRR